MTPDGSTGADSRAGGFAEDAARGTARERWWRRAVGPVEVWTNDLAARPDPRELEFPQGPAEDRAPSPAEARLRHNLSQGIRAQEGAEAFGRALALGLPQVAVSSMDLPALVAQAEAEILCF